MSASVVVIKGLPLADGPGEIAPLTLVFDTRPPQFKTSETIPAFIDCARAFYRNAAESFVDLLQQHTPGGFVDAVFGVLAARKASVFRVAEPPRVEALGEIERALGTGDNAAALAAVRRARMEA